MQINETQKIFTTDPLKAATQQTTTKKVAGPAPSTPSSASGASISSSDFLTLLVTEMKNQDPTANTDPNAYINQLVGVNSLQQLIQINSTLGGIPATATTGHSAAIANALSRNHVVVDQAETARLPAAFVVTAPMSQL